MHNHNNENGYKGMMWMMVIFGALLLGALLFDRSSFSSGGYLWLILIGVFVVAHIWMMFKGHGGHKEDGVEDKSSGTSTKQPETKDDYLKHKSGGCCG